MSPPGRCVFFVLELKHYSGDTFWALLLPALAAAALEDRRGPVPSAQTTSAWWLAAAIGLWFGNGAVFVTPACAVALVFVAWWRGGWRMTRKRQPQMRAIRPQFPRDASP